MGRGDVLTNFTVDFVDLLKLWSSWICYPVFPDDISGKLFGGSPPLFVFRFVDFSKCRILAKSKEIDDSIIVDLFSRFRA